MLVSLPEGASSPRPYLVSDGINLESGFADTKVRRRGGCHPVRHWSGRGEVAGTALAGGGHVPSLKKKAEPGAAGAAAEQGCRCWGEIRR